MIWNSCASDYAHRRLGFSDREVQGWFAAAGLKLDESEHHRAGAPATEKLTVKIWLRHRQGANREAA